MSAWVSALSNAAASAKTNASSIAWSAPTTCVAPNNWFQRMNLACARHVAEPHRSRLREGLLIEVREEHPGDIATIRDLNKSAFGQDQEGNIVDALRSNGAALLSLVA